jgi:hypothetical protein
MNHRRRTALVFVFCCFVWAIIWAWVALTRRNSFLLPAILGVIPVTLLWLEDSLRRRSGTPAAAYADLMLCCINCMLALESWNSRRWLMGSSLTIFFGVFAFWWFNRWGPSRNSKVSRPTDSAARTLNDLLARIPSATVTPSEVPPRHLQLPKGHTSIPETSGDDPPHSATG